MKEPSIHIPHAFYDYSKLIEAAKKESQYTDFSSFIAEKIREYRDKYYDGEAHYCTRDSLAAKIGIDSSTLTKIINGSQSTRKRDIIIALCISLRLSLNETNQALNLYLMAALNPHNLRDLVISKALDDGCPVTDLNCILEKHKFPMLDLVRNKNNKNPQQFYYSVKASKYKEVSVNVHPYCVAGDDSERSLHERYRPDQYDFHAEMLIERKDEPSIKFRITLDNGIYEISHYKDDEWVCLYTNEPFRDKYFGIPLCEEADLLNEISRLQEYVDRKARDVRAICADTRNYISRFDAINDNGKLIIFGECFGADAPELCEYYQLKISADEFTFSISDQSVFLEEYLGSELWKKLYGELIKNDGHSFTSIEQIPDIRWRSHCKSLLNEAQNLIRQLQDRSLFLFNARAWIDIDDLMHTYGVEDDFDCVQPDDLPYKIVPQKDSIMGCDGIPITIDDLYRAAELEIHSIEELCAVREKYGSLEGLLKIDMLSEQKGNEHE